MHAAIIACVTPINLTEVRERGLKYLLGERRVECRGKHYIAPNATLIGSVVLEDQASVWFNAVIRADNDLIIIGEGSNVQDGSVLHTDNGVRLTIGRGSTIGHMVVLHGCTIGDNTLIGIKSVILNHARIGSNCIIGANSLITEGKEIPDNSLVMGAPGKVIRQLTSEEIERVRMNAVHYVEKIEVYRQGMAQQG
ncbi:MAG: gamma carbonic anhydrase family protein [Burkholderiales bacterium]|nr:gamma carbonic anhydrase family protein [Burkholderiales bacterium]